jgi:hypothetical protein
MVSYEFQTPADLAAVRQRAVSVARDHIATGIRRWLSEQTDGPRQFGLGINCPANESIGVDVMLEAFNSLIPDLLASDWIGTAERCTGSLLVTLTPIDQPGDSDAAR